MVLLSVKGTTFPDEFVMECLASTAISPEFVQTVCHEQNARHQVRLQLLSAHELYEEAAANAPGAHTAEALATFKGLIDTIGARLKDKTAPVAPGEFDRYAESLRDATERLFAAECAHSDGRDAAVARLYELHDNPELDEARRLVVYHCRAILDREWKVHELQREDKAGLWFCGKLMDGALSRYVGSNEKSRLTVKVHPRDGAPPSGEPRIRYDDQRALFERMRQRREEYKTLEESELRDRVVAQARGRVALGGAPEDAVRVDASRLRPIHPQREERDVC